MDNFFSLSDFGKIRLLSDVKIARNADYMIAVSTHRDINLNAHTDNLIRLGSHDEKVELISEGSLPQWSPDEKSIAFVKDDENGVPAIWIINMLSGKKNNLVNIFSSEYFMGHYAETNFSWSPDGKYIAYISTEPSGNDFNKKEVEVIDSFLYKTKGGRGRRLFAEKKNYHVWMVAIEGGNPVCLTKGEYNEHSLCWSPDSSYIAFISNRSGKEDINYCNDLWIVNTRTAEIEKIETGHLKCFNPVWSPSGKYIGWIGAKGKTISKDSQAEDNRLYVTDITTKEYFCLSKGFDRRINKICWHPNEKLIYFTAGSAGSTGIYSLDFFGKTEVVLTGDYTVKDFSLSHSGNEIALIKNDITHPDEIYLYHTESKILKRVSNENGIVSQNCHFSDVETFWIESFDETPVQGWLMKPAAFTSGRKYPLILVIHGGPHNMFGYEFEERMQLLSGRGYGVLFMNPRGSYGYGQSFSSGCKQNWGGGDYQDLMAGIEFILSHNDWIDPERLGVTGQSYGGYMTNWIITQTKRFKAAVSDGSISNLISFAGTSLYSCLIEAEFNGLPCENYSLLWQWSPLRNVKNVSTPTLFLHGEKDNEVPVSQAEEMYSAVKRLEVETALVRYQEEGHGWRPDLKPLNRMDLYKRMFNWYEMYLK
ncbi:MAG: ptpA 5 [Chitinophagaceae bacterium]|nr:ptpA 5 [Chitinophagaceae bacterium]